MNDSAGKARYKKRQIIINNSTASQMAAQKYQTMFVTS